MISNFHIQTKRLKVYYGRRQFFCSSLLKSKGYTYVKNNNGGQLGELKVQNITRTWTHPRLVIHF